MKRQNAVRMRFSNFNGLGGRGSRIRTCDLKYPKLPRYRAALYPVFAGVANMGRRPEQGRRRAATRRRKPYRSCAA
jgi:hypothetical protein